MSAHAHDTDAHVDPISLYLKVYGALLVLTVFTVLVSHWDLGAISPALGLGAAMGIAAVKGSLVILFFMHVLHDDKLIGLIIVLSLFFMALFFSVTMFDASSRDSVTWREETQAYRDTHGLSVINDLPSHDEHAAEGEHAADGEHAAADDHAAEGEPADEAAEAPEGDTAADEAPAEEAAH